MVKRAVPVLGALLLIFAAGLAAPATAGNDAGMEHPLAPPADRNGSSSHSPSYRFNGTIISTSGASAIIGKRLLRAGDRIGEATLLSVQPRLLEMPIDGRRVELRLGESLDASPSPQHHARVTIRRSAGTSEPVRYGDVRSPARAIALDERQAQENARKRGVGEQAHRHVVEPGETLSGIAAGYRHGAMTHGERMAAIYEANPRAFDGSMDRLRAGAPLRLPVGGRRMQAAPENDRTMLAENNENSQKDVKISKNSLKKAEDRLSRRISYGDTLSGIASDAGLGQLTLNQVMMAFYAANRDAFDGNINRLRAGALIRMPTREDLEALSPERAATFVRQHMADWQSKGGHTDRGPYLAST